MSEPDRIGRVGREDDRQDAYPTGDDRQDAYPTLGIVAAVRAALGPARELVLLHRPFLPPTAWDYVKECLDTGWVSSAGAFVTRFEEELARITGCRRAVAVVNGTAALQVCL